MVLKSQAALTCVSSMVDVALPASDPTRTGDCEGLHSSGNGLGMDGMDDGLNSPLEL